MAYIHGTTAGFTSLFLALAGFATIMFLAALTFPSGAPVPAKEVV